MYLSIVLSLAKYVHQVRGIHVLIEFSMIKLPNKKRVGGFPSHHVTFWFKDQVFTQGGYIILRQSCQRENNVMTLKLTVNQFIYCYGQRYNAQKLKEIAEKNQQSTCLYGTKMSLPDKVINGNISVNVEKSRIFSGRFQPSFHGRTLKNQTPISAC